MEDGDIIYIGKGSCWGWGGINKGSGYIYTHSIEQCASYRYDGYNSGCGQPADYDLVHIDTSVDTPAISNISNSDGDGTYVVDWSSESGASEYELQEQRAGGSWNSVYNNSGTQTTRSGRSSGQWCYRVQGCNSTECSGWSGTKCTWVKPNAPSLYTISNTDGDGTYTVDWSSASAATGYELQEQHEGGTWSSVYSGSNTQDGRSGRSPGRWCYRVLASNPGGDSSWSATKCVTVKPDVPEGLNVSNLDGSSSYTINWSSTATATGYDLQEQHEGGSWEVVYTGEETQATRSEQVPGQWCYQVRASNAGGESAWSSTVCTWVKPYAPTAYAISNEDGDGNYLVEWSEPNTATGYDLQEHHMGGEWAEVYTGSTSQYSITLRTPGDWCYQARASNPGGKSSWSNTTCATVKPYAPILDTISNTAGEGNYTVSWSSAFAAIGYELQEQHEGGSWSTVYSDSETQTTRSERTPGEWCYQVRASNAGGNSDWSVIECTTVRPASPTVYNISNNDGDGDYTLDWSEPATSTGYELQEQHMNGTWSSIYSGSASEFSITQRTAGEWCYRARASNDGGISDWGDKTCTTVKPDAPSLDSISNTNGENNYTINWSNSFSAIKYELQEQKEGGSWSRIYFSNGTETTRNNRDPGEWCYRVAASNSGGSSDWSDIQCTTVRPNAPSLYAISNIDGNSNYTVDWSEPDAATDYELQEQHLGGIWSVIYADSTSQFSVTDRVAGEWCYQVKASNAGGDSDLSNIVCTTVKPISPTLNPIQNFDQDNVYTITWNTPPTVLTYELEESDSPTFDSPTVRYSGALTRFPIVDQPEGTWYYRVLASNAGGDSPWSNTEFVKSNIPPAKLDIDSPQMTLVDTPTFVGASLYPITSTAPVTYVWQTTDHPPIVHSSIVTTSNHLTDTVTFLWDNPGTKTITVTASNIAGSVLATDTLHVDLVVSKHASPEDTVSSGGVLRYTIAYTNPGNIAVNNRIITDSIPLHTSFLSANRDGHCENGIVRWTIDSIPPGGYETVHFSVQTDEHLTVGDVITNVAWINTSERSLFSTNLTTSTIALKPDFGLVRKTVAAEHPVQPEDLITYTVHYTNAGTLTAFGTVITDVLHAYTSHISGCSSDNEIVHCDVGTVASGESGHAAFTVRLEDNAPVGSVLTNTAYIASNQTEPVRTNPVTVSITAPVLTLKQTVSPSGSVLPGTVLTYTITASNTGNYEASNVVIANTLADGLTHLGGGTVQNDRILSWNLGTLAVGQQEQMQFTAWISDTVAKVSNRAYLHYGRDRFLSSNPVTTTIAAPILRVNKSVEPVAKVYSGENLTYTLHYTNAGVVPATGVMLLDPMPSGTTYVDGGFYVPEEQMIRFPIGNLGPGMSGVVDYSVKVNENTSNITVTNIAEVFADQTYSSAYVSATPVNIAGDQLFAPVGGYAGLNYVAQSFIATAPRLKRIGVYASGVASPYPALRLLLCQDVGGYPSFEDPVAVGDSINDLSTDGRRYFITPHYPISLTVGNRYWLVIDGMADTETHGYAGTKYSERAYYSEGTWMYSSDGGTSWTVSGGDTSDLDMLIEYAPPPQSNSVHNFVLDSGEDVYEPDDNCASANPLSTDAEIQEHSFSHFADEDWGYFTTITDTTYVVQAKSTNSEADLMLQLHDMCGSPILTDTNAFGNDAQIVLEASHSDTYYVEVRNRDPQIYGANVTYELSARTESGAGIVIIVAGNDDEYSLQDNILYAANMAYRTFRAGGFPEEHIRYLSAISDDRRTDADEDGISDVYAPSTSAQVKEALTVWAASLTDGRMPLYLYMIDHGLIDVFKNHGDNDTITPVELDGWLTDFESTGSPINVIYEACHSGSFIDGVAEISAPGRVIIASTDRESNAYALDRRGAHFSDAFFTALRQNQDLYASFQRGNEAVEKTGYLQHPWLDDNGNGVPNDNDEGELARTRGLINSAFAGGRPPVIDDVSPPIEIQNGQGTLRATVRDDGNLAHVEVWAYVYSPSFKEPEPSPDGTLPELNLPQVNLSDTNGDGEFIGIYEDFSEQGIYRVMFYAEDGERNLSQPVTLELQTACKVYLPLVLRGK